MIGPGRIVGSLRVNKSITVRGAGRHRTVFLSRGLKAALMVEAKAGARVVVEGMSFTTLEDAEKRRGAGVMLSGPGEIVLRDVSLRRTIAGRCLASAVTTQGPLRLRMERVQILDHQCF